MGTYADQILWEKCQKQFKTNVQQEALKEQHIAPLTGLDSRYIRQTEPIIFRNFQQIIRITSLVNLTEGLSFVSFSLFCKIFSVFNSFFLELNNIMYSAFHVVKIYANTFMLPFTSPVNVPTAL